MAGVREIFEIVDRATRPLRNIGNEMQSVHNQATGLRSAVTGLVAGFATLATVRKAIALSDELSLVQARLNNVNDGLQTTAELQEMIYQAAQRSRGEYIGMMGTVAGLKAQTGDTFSSVKEAVAFTELLQKQFKIAGTDATGISSTMYNLTQALSTGVLRGQDLNIVMSNAPQIAQRIARYMGLSVGELKKVAAEGKVTSQIVKNAMLSGADEINQQFEEMPMTFGDAMTRLQNMAVRAFQPVGQMISDAINSSGVEEALNGIGRAVYVVMAVIGTALSFIMQGFGIIGQGIGFITGLFGGAGNIAATVIGFVVGVFLGAEAVIVNAVMAVGNFFTTLIVTLQNNWAYFCYDAQSSLLDFASGAVRAFADVVRGAESAANAIANAFISGANAAIGGINGLINAINQIPGVNLSTVSEVAAASVDHGLSDAIDNIAATLEGMKPDAPVMRLLDPVSPDYINVGDAFAKGQDIGAGWVNGITEGMNNITDFGGFGDLFNAGDFSNLMPAGGDVGKVGKVGKVDNVKLSDEDLKIYRDLAERRYMNNIELKTLAPEITVNLPAGASGNLSAQDVADRLKRMLIEQMAAQTAVSHG
jgi:tape measure domain-containing protein